MAGIIISGNHYDNVRFAITEEEQIKGLMYRLRPVMMVFAYKKASNRNFWMKDTPSPLDIIFCNNRKVVHIAKGIPFSEDLIASNFPCDLVVETYSGFCRKNNIRNGSDIKIKYDKIILQKLMAV